VAVGVALVGLALLGAALMGLAAVLTLKNPVSVDGTSTQTIFGFWKLLYSTSAPPIGIVVAAAGFGLLLAAIVALVERRVTTLARTNDDRERMPLAPKLVMADTRGVYAGPVTVTVLIPAHNEAACIAETIASLRSQSHQPAGIVVIADNCTDDTAPIARALGVEVFETQGNTKKKAGALNQALPAVLADLGDNDAVMVMDADTTLDQGFLASAVSRLSDDRALMAVGGLFYGDEGAGLIGQFQRNEYSRYAREISRRRGRVFVLTGTASIFRPRALRTVAAERGRSIPGVPGDFYDTLALTEDNELTLAIKSLGGLMISPGQCTVVTEVMQTWRALWAQRLRWQRGAVENLGSYGLRPSVTRYWAQQLGIGYGVVAIAAYVLLVALMALASLNLFTGAPVFAIWVGSRVQGDAGGLSMTAVVAVVVVMAMVCWGLVWALNRMGAAHDALVGRPTERRQTPWMKPFNAGRAQAQQATLRVLDKVLVGAVVVAGLGFEAWFFFFAGSSLG
jgi:cellulose synthase/poly-beta-1,6-N-acetylglucosamine synthase-like glycosyltransferase